MYFDVQRSNITQSQAPQSPPAAVSTRQLSNVCETRCIIWLVKRREWKQNCHMFLTLAWAWVFIKALGMRLLYNIIFISYNILFQFHFIILCYLNSPSNWIEYLFKKSPFNFYNIIIAILYNVLKIFNRTQLRIILKIKYHP